MKSLLFLENVHRGIQTPPLDNKIKPPPLDRFLYTPCLYHLLLCLCKNKFFLKFLKCCFNLPCVIAVATGWCFRTKLNNPFPLFQRPFVPHSSTIPQHASHTFFFSKILSFSHSCVDVCHFYHNIFTF